MTSPLQQAYNALLGKAPGAAFRRARTLYLNKYPLPQNDASPSLRLYVCAEQLSETQEPTKDGHEHHRIVTLTSRPGELAVVHWQCQEAPQLEAVLDYLKTTWSLQVSAVDLLPHAEPWFRDGGYQIRLKPPEDLIWQQRSLLTLKA